MGNIDSCGTRPYNPIKLSYILRNMKRLSYLKSGLTVLTALATITLTFLPSIAENPRNSNNRFDRDYSSPNSQPSLQTPTPSSEDLGKQLVQDLSQCMRNAIPNNEPESLEQLQAASMQCTVRVIILTPDGKVRTDANERMNAILTAMNVSLPATVSQGQATVKLERIPESFVYTVPVVLGGKTQRFLLDTGASNSILYVPAFLFSLTNIFTLFPFKSNTSSLMSILAGTQYLIVVFSLNGLG